MERPVKVLAYLLEDVGRDVREADLALACLVEAAWIKVKGLGKSEAGEGYPRCNRGGIESHRNERKPEAPKGTWRGEHVANGVGDHGRLLVDDELEALGADELDEASGVFLLLGLTRSRGLSLAQHLPSPGIGLDWIWSAASVVGLFFSSLHDDGRMDGDEDGEGDFFFLLVGWWWFRSA